MKKPQEIKTLRTHIDQIHMQILDLVLERIQISKKIWAHKKAKNLKLTDKARETELVHLFDNNKKIKTDPELKKMIHTIQKVILSENKKYLTKKAKNAKI